MHSTQTVWSVFMSAVLGLVVVGATQAEPAAVPADNRSATQVAQAVPAPPPPPVEAAPEGPDAPATGGGRQLLLPEISFIGSAIGKLSSDRRDADRNRIRLDEAEIGVQSYVYPNVRADAFIVMPGHEEFKAELEEGYLTHEQLPLRFTGRLGKFFVPFGRTNQLHPHSWPYARRPLAWRNLVAGEALVGNGVSLSWLAPTGGSLFFQLDAGTYTKAGHSHSHEEEEHEAEAAGRQAEEPAADLDTILEGHGAEFSDKFHTARAWAGLPLLGGEFELGGSWARGQTEFVTLPGDLPGSRSLQITGADLTYRRYGQVAQRFLLRGEYLWHRYRSDLGRDRTRGYYALATYRWDRWNDFGFLYDWSGIPESGGLRESALSAIYTRQFTEQTYARLQATHGDRPGKPNYNEVWLQLVWGMGPHTHALE